MNNLIVATGKGGLWFNLIYMITIFIVTGFFCIQGMKQKRSFITMWLITISGMLFFLIGIHIFPLTSNELKMLLFSGSPIKQGEKSVLGGLLVIIGLLISIAWLKEKIYLIDNLAIPFIIGVGLQNVGCFMAGCCYGNPSNLPWSVHYGSGSPAFIAELQEGIVKTGETVTLSLHPVQLYLLTGCLLIAFVVWKFRNRLKAPLSQFIFGWMLYSVLRFFMEFLRDPVTNHGLGNAVAGMKVLQWVLLVTALILGIILFIRESQMKDYEFVPVPLKVNNLRLISLLAFILLMSLWTGRLFGFIEKLLINSALTSSFLIIGWRVIKDNSTPRYRFATIAGILTAVVLMGQSYIPKNKDEKVTYTEIGGGIQVSRFYNEIKISRGKFQGADCDGNPTYYTRYDRKNIRNNYISGSLSLAKTENLDMYRRFKYGTNLSFGSLKETGIDTTYNKNLLSLSAQPYLTYDTRYIGLTAGINLGQFQFSDLLTKNIDPPKGETIHEVKNQFIYPSLKLRFGPYDIIYAEGFLAHHFPSASPLMLYGIGIGSGLGRVDGTNIGYGYTGHINFLKASIPVNKNYFIDAFYGFPVSSDMNYDKNSQFSIGIHYRFNYKTVPLKNDQKTVDK